MEGQGDLPFLRQAPEVQNLPGRLHNRVCLQEVQEGEEESEAMRCYNGAWDSEAQALFKEQDRLLEEVKKHEPEAHCTYHPDGETFVVHVWGRPISDVCKSRIAALNSALERFNA